MISNATCIWKCCNDLHKQMKNIGLINIDQNHNVEPKSNCLKNNFHPGNKDIDCTRKKINSWWEIYRKRYIIKTP